MNWFRTMFEAIVDIDTSVLCHFLPIAETAET